MFRYLIILFSVGCVKTAHCQFIYTKQDSVSNYFFSVAEEKGSNNLLISNTSGTYIASSGYINYKGEILRVNNNGLLLNSISSGTNSFFAGSLLNVGNYYYTFLVRCNGSNFSSISFIPQLIKYDLNFNIISKIQLDSSYVNPIGLTQHIIQKNGSLYFGYTRQTDNTIAIYKTDLDLNKKDSLKFTGTMLMDISNYGNKILISGNGFPLGSLTGNNQVVVLDTTLNVVSRFNLDSLSYVNPGCASKIGLTYNYATLHEVSPKRYVVGGYYDVVYNSGCSTDMQYIEALIDQNQTVIQTNILGKQNGTDEIFGYSSGDMKYGYVYNTGMSGYSNSNPTPPQNNVTEIMLSKTDTLGNLKWLNYYSTPNNYYYPMAVEGTTDSGVVVTGMRYNLTAPTITNSCEGFVMKVDKNGIQQYLGIAEANGLNINNIKCYPNPVKDLLFFDLPLQEGFTIEVQDVFGKTLLIENNYIHHSGLIISSLSSGTYFYKIKSNKNNFTGKFIKE